MKRFFAVIVGLDVLLLALPTGWMGPWTEFWIAIILAFATALLWFSLKWARNE